MSNKKKKSERIKEEYFTKNGVKIIYNEKNA